MLHHLIYVPTKSINITFVYYKQFNLMYVPATSINKIRTSATSI
jgi:hypothetical protein